MGIRLEQLDKTSLSNLFITNNTYTANDVLSKIVTVDGEGKGLDADLLDGKQASDFLSKENTDGGDLNNIWATGFYNGTFSNYPSGLPDGQGNVIILNYATANNSGWTRQIFISAHNKDICIRNSSNSVWQSWTKVWHSDNDGTGSGLDADTVDNKHASEFFASGPATTGVDPNAAPDGASYMNGTINAPSFFGGDHSGTLYQKTYSTIYITQIAIAFNSLDLAIRAKIGGTWSAWTSIEPKAYRTDWSTKGAIDNVAGQLAWKNFGNGHTIFDASNAISPSGTVISNTNPETVWGGSYPTLMGWNGVNTYGVRVDSARIADTVASGVTGLHRITTSTAAASGGVDGDIWFTYS